jgi:hypothetical protein
VIGIVGGVVLLLIVAVAILCAVRGRKVTSASSGNELENPVWITVLGNEMENPITLIDPDGDLFAYDRE